MVSSFGMVADKDFKRDTVVLFHMFKELSREVENI